MICQQYGGGSNLSRVELIQLWDTTDSQQTSVRLTTTIESSSHYYRYEISL